MTISHARSRDLLGALALVVLATGCAGDGCAGVTPIPGGFPPEDRVANAVQFRLSSSGVGFFEADPGAIVAGVLGQGQDLSFQVPPACASSDNPQICCDDAGMPMPSCGPVAIDLDEQPGDLPRAELDPIEGASTLTVVVRPRVATVAPIPIEYDTGFGTASCDVHIDTAPGDFADLKLTVSLQLVGDPAMATTKMVVDQVAVEQLESDDITLSGGFSCSFGNWIVGYFLDTLSETFANAIEDALSQQVCSSCPSGDVAECSAFADACVDQVCMRGDECVQELGLSGRLSAVGLLSSMSPGTQGAIDLYAVAGGDAATDGGGLALGFLGGLLPAATERDRCGPPSTRPADVAIEPSAYFQGNTRPDTGEPFDFALGIHEHDLDLFSWSAYESGFLCLNVETSSVPLLTSDTLALVIPSLVGLLHGETGQIRLGLRPQEPPSIVLGPGTYIETPSGEREVDEPLLDVRFAGLEVDVFLMVDDRFIRVLTLRADVRLPINLDVDENGEVLPVLGNLDEAFTNLSVHGSEALTEDPAELAERFPALLSLALPQLLRGVGSFALPEVGGVGLDLGPGGITAVDDDTYLALFGTLRQATTASARVVTEASLVEITRPKAAAFQAGRWDRQQRPEVELALGGRAEGGGALEWSVRTDGGAWSPYTRSPRLRLSRPSFWLQGRHTVEVRARAVGQPHTTDLSPVVLRPLIAPSDGPIAVPREAPGAAGCAAGTAETTAGGLLLLLVALGLVGRRPRRSLGRALGGRALWLGLAGAGAAVAPAGCSCGSDPADLCADDLCADGEVEPGPTGRWSSIAADGDRVVIAAYEESFGDLVLLDVAGEGEPVRRVVDGVPGDAAPVLDPGGYRGGVREAGPDVGAFTSVALQGGRARIAYQDRDTGALRFAAEADDGSLSWHVVDAATGAAGAQHSSLAIAPDGAPAVAYLSVGVDDGSGGLLAQLRLARASSAAPASEADWAVEILDEAPVSCAGLCGDGAACLADDGGATERCAPTSDDCGGCGDDEVCVAGSCQTPVPDPVAHDLPAGTGLFANLAYLPTGEAVVVYHDRVAGDLVMQLDDGGWSRIPLDADPGTDAGRWADALVDDTGAVHVAYQDGLDRLLYLRWSAGATGPIEVVDDGTREGDRTHPVGASAALFQDAAGELAIAYQDAFASDLWIARRGSDGWALEPLLSGPELYGFYTAAATAAGVSWISTYAYDRATYPPGELVLHRQ